MFAQPLAKGIAADYEGDYFENYIHRDEGSPIVDAYRDLLGRLERLTQGRRLLDVGCGAGGFLRHARTAGWTVRGVDGSAAGIRYATEVLGLDAAIQDLDSDSFALPDQSYDVVRSFHVLEHLRNPGRVLSQCHRALVPDGLLSLGLPYYVRGRIRAHHAMLTLGLARCPYRFGLPDHLAYFTPRTLVESLARRGFVVLEVTYTSVRSAAGIADQLIKGGGLRGRLMQGFAWTRPLLSAIRWTGHINVLAQKRA